MSSTGKFARRKGEAAVFNKAALEVVKNHPEIQINDLHGKITKSAIFEKWFKQNNVHFYDQGKLDFIGIGILASILLPSLQKARAMGKWAVCVNNIKQVGFLHLH